MRAVAVLVVVILAGCHQAGTQPAAVPTATTPAAERTPAPRYPKAGDAVTIQAGAAGNMFLMGDWDAYLNYPSGKTKEQKAISLSMLEKEGRLFLADNGTRATVLELRRTAARIKIEAGPHAGKSGWLDAEFIKLAD